MKTPFALFALGLLAASSIAFSADKPASNQLAGYPLKTCVVSDEALGSMGDAFRYVHKEKGKPDRTIFLCCDGCVDDFKKEPAKYLKKLDDAAKANSADGKKS